ncbi:oligosaccharide flippase family protein [Rubellicoccus peritrichatus]|uniref:Oligosaccharide flippase family protein n=1 Tax=Rubellicoccus peritrichatus TaxID=3080537 RepID=A0AAQ3QUM5_9BACT|nr:oligosaccharide flippase family protein [Puniceicoccus sp. CR14]WOO42526.1 oligosaccharide flippase family protein [Puniceicoccus sp. CR14]
MIKCGQRLRRFVISKALPVWLKQGTWMVVLQLLGKLASLAGGIWAARCLGPEKLGVSGMAFVLMPAFYLFGGLKLDVFLVRHYADFEKEGKEGSIADAYFTFQLMNVGVLTFFGLIIVAILGLPSDGIITLLVAVPVMFLASSQPLWLLQARERMPAFYFGNTVFAFVNAGLLFALVRPGSPAGVDLLAYLGGLTIAWLLMWRSALNQRILPRLNFAWLNRIWDMARANQLVFVTGIFMFVMNALEAPLVGWLAGIEELGLYRTALIVANSLQTFLHIIPLLLYPKLVAWQRENPSGFRVKQNRLATVFFGLALLASLCVFMLSPLLYSILFGAEFASAALPFALLFSAKLVVIVSGIYTWGLWAKDETVKPLIVIAPVAIISLIADFILIPTYGMTAAAAISLVSELCVLAGMFIYANREAGR